MYILGISAFYHDSAACLIKDGKIVFASQEERYTRKKHDESFPRRAINASFDYANIHINDIDIVAYYDKPFQKFERILETYLTYAPKGISSFIKAMPLWIKEKIWIKDLIQKELNYAKKIIFPEHHLSHAASAFFPSPFEEAAFLTLDGVGEWTTTSYGTGKGNKIEIDSEISFPHSIGLLYSSFTYYIGFKINSGEYKVMGLAPYGKPIYKKIILDELLNLRDDGSFKLNMKYFNYCVGLTMTNKRFNKLFGGPPRNPETKISQRDMDLASSIQEVTEEIILKCVNHIYKETKQKNICLAGGVALNCVGTGKILRESPFENIWIQPAAGDAGGALGAALYAWYHYDDNKRQADNQTDSQFGSYLGPEFNDEDIKKYLIESDIPFTKLKTRDIGETIADLINDEKVIGWFQGRMEFGPRALGARSIIGDARSSKMQEIMNLKIKFRESFRPFAPSILKENITDYFDINTESPYMLLVAPVKKEKLIPMTDAQKNLFGIDKLLVKRSVIPAVTHVDYSARIQSVSQETNPLYYQMIQTFNEKYNCPVIINTSFNVRGEPIVCTPDNAYRCFMRTNMDHLLMGNYLIDKSKQQSLEKDTDWTEEFTLD